jgi:hypothetical protein
MMASVCAHAAQAHTPTTCQLITFKGHVMAGEEFSRPVGSGLVFVLSPTETGWGMEIDGPDSTASIGTTDYLGIATPPYHPDRIAFIDASYGQTVQQAVKFSPREFHFALNEKQFREIGKVVKTAFRGGDGTNAAEQQEAEDPVRDQMHEITGNGRLSITGFRLGKVKGGSTDAIMAISFEVELHVPDSFVTDGESIAESSGCSR